MSFIADFSLRVGKWSISMNYIELRYVALSELMCAHRGSLVRQPYLRRNTLYRWSHGRAEPDALEALELLEHEAVGRARAHDSERESAVTAMARARHCELR
jgi:hypothetical protein